MHSSLYRNSIYLMGSSLFTALFGFVFWIINARLFSTQDVGIATTMVSTAGFISGFSLLGLKNSLIRYLPQSLTRNNKINTSFNIVTLVSIILSFAFVVAAPVLSKELTFLRNNLLYLFLFVIFLSSFSLNQIQEGIFVAYRSTGYVLIKDILWGLTKIILPILLFSFGAFGIFSAFSFGSVISLLFGFYILKIKFNYKASLIINKHTVKHVGKFSFSNYLGLFLAEVPYFVLPLIILNRLGAEEAAFYYIAMQIAGILFIIPSAVNQSLFAEGSQEEGKTKTHLINSLKFNFMLLIPLILLIIIFGGYVLQIFGKHYSENALTFLQILAVSGLFIGINQVGSALVHVQKKVYLYVLLNLISTGVTIVLSHFLLIYGLFGVGVSFLIGYGIVSIAYFLILKKSLR